MTRHHGGVDLNSGIVGIIGLFVIAGGGIVVVDAFIIRKVRRLGPPPDAPSKNRSIDA